MSSNENPQYYKNAAIFNARSHQNEQNLYLYLSASSSWDRDTAKCLIHYLLDFYITLLLPILITNNTE